VPAHACSCGAVYRLSCNAFKRMSIVDIRASAARWLASYLNTTVVRQVSTDLAVGLANKCQHLPHAQPGASWAADRTHVDPSAAPQRRQGTHGRRSAAQAAVRMLAA
jgi:hypothetical protein